jgi:hypothetical protein
MKLLSLGDDAAEMLLKHKGVSVPLLETFGNSATRALRKITPQNGRRLAMIKEKLLAGHRAAKLLQIVEKHGDPAMEWIWKNKAPLAVSAAMAAFLANPEPFIDGTRQLADTVAKEVVTPVTSKVIDGGAGIARAVVAHVARPVATEFARAAARKLPWRAVSFAVVTVIAGLTALRLLIGRLRRCRVRCGQTVPAASVP